MKSLFFGILCFLLAQVIIWFQTNAQFLNTWAKDNPWTLSLVGGTLISILFIKGTANVAGFYDGLIWPSRIISFATGILSFAFLTWWILKEPLTMKTIVCLVLSFIIVGIQIFWK
tara:strand:+ start:2097 stop:2441 length:345 start_codon:yes stop_codon:yes gene_type:complete